MLAINEKSYYGNQSLMQTKPDFRSAFVKRFMTFLTKPHKVSDISSVASANVSDISRSIRSANFANFLFRKILSDPSVKIPITDLLLSGPFKCSESLLHSYLIRKRLSLPSMTIFEGPRNSVGINLRNRVTAST